MSSTLKLGDCVLPLAGGSIGRPAECADAQYPKARRIHRKERPAELGEHAEPRFGLVRFRKMQPKQLDHQDCGQNDSAGRLEAVQDKGHHRTQNPDDEAGRQQQERSGLQDD